MALQPWRTAKVTRIVDETADTKRFWLEVPELTSFDFTPGQFITLDLPIHEKPNKRWRSYSIASWPDGSNVLELVIVLDKQGAGTPWIWANVEIGTELLFRGPQGVFIMHEPLDKDIFLVCTGTGIAPFRSMVNYVNTHNIAYKRIFLIFGCRTRSTLLYYDEFINLDRELENFQYIPTLSREEWHGKSGYVHAIYEEICRERQPANFFLCGWKGMIDEARKRITDMGYDKKAVHVEIYG